MIRMSESLAQLTETVSKLEREFRIKEDRLAWLESSPRSIRQMYVLLARKHRKLIRAVWWLVAVSSGCVCLALWVAIFY